MKIEYVAGDLIAGPEYLIMHGCNGLGVMGAGVSVAIRSRYPEAYRFYRAKFEATGLLVGDVVWADCGDRIIANAITQARYGRDPNIVYVSYEGIREAFTKINNFCFKHGIKRVGLPLIGAGLGNGSWAAISQIIEEESGSFTPVVYLLDGVVPAN